jgi:hypothetical protein
MLGNVMEPEPRWRAPRLLGGVIGDSCQLVQRIPLVGPGVAVLDARVSIWIIGDLVDAWADQRGVKLHLFQPGEPKQDAFALESFNAQFHDKCLNELWSVPQ